MQDLKDVASEYGQPFRNLQQELRESWQKIEEFDGGDCDIIVIPSISLDRQEMQKVPGAYHYEERHLFSLIRLRNPRTRLIYITSEPLHPMIVDYYLQLLPGIPWDIQAIEINLRKGGTTHPFMALKLLTNGRYEGATGAFYSQQGRPKYYVASDNLKKERYRGLLPNDLMDIIADNQLHFDSGTETGTVFHLMGCLSEFGKLGLTSIGNSSQEAQEIYNKVVKVLDRETSC